MSTNAAQVKFSVNNQTSVVNTPSTGISFLMGRSERGPFADPKDIINTWSQFQKIYGGLLDYTDSIHKVQRILEKGGSIRFSRVGHYTTIGTASSLDAVKAAPDDDFTDGLNELFELLLKNPGADGNKFHLAATAASNGDTDYFNIELSHDDLGVLETYQNLTIPGQPTILQSKYLEAISLGSQYLNVVYKDCSGFTGVLVPDPVVIDFTGGSNGTTPVDADYVGDSGAANGFYAFDKYDDSMQIMVLEAGLGSTVHVGGAAYATGRKDLIYFMHMANTLLTASTIIAAKAAYNIDTQYCAFFAGGLKINDPVTNTSKNIEAISDIAALASASENDFGAWYSFAGHNRGVIYNALGVVNNFGSPAKMEDLNDLANRQINMIINRNNKIMLWGNFSGQLANNQESQLSVVRLLIYLRKTLIPALEYYLEEPNDIPTWKRIFYTVRPFLDSLVTKRALYSYSWQGDQDASSMSSLSVNDPAEVSQGIYKIQLGVQIIPAIREIQIAINMSQAGVSFEIVS